MNTQSTAVPGSFAEPQRISSIAQSFYWSVRRELWENRAIYIAPLIVAGVFLFGFLISFVRMRRRMSGAWPSDIAQQHDLLKMYELGAALIMGTVLIVGLFYTLDALYGERRDRSILFWKSLPVSDTITVLAKLTIPIIILPLLSFIISIGTQFIMLLMSSVLLAGSGADIASLWTHVSFFQISLVILYHLLMVHGLWYAPLYSWLLLVSAWAPRAPFIWAVLPPFVICGVEKIAFNSSNFLSMLQFRLLGPGGEMGPEQHSKGFMATLIPEHFFSTPGLWSGLAIAALFLFATVRLRRYRGPI